jgi:hypothetical protein
VPPGVRRDQRRGRGPCPVVAASTHSHEGSRSARSSSGGRRRRPLFRSPSLRPAGRRPRYGY